MICNYSTLVGLVVALNYFLTLPNFVITSTIFRACTSLHLLHHVFHYGVSVSTFSFIEGHVMPLNGCQSLWCMGSLDYPLLQKTATILHWHKHRLIYSSSKSLTVVAEQKMHPITRRQYHNHVWSYCTTHLLEQRLQPSTLLLHPIP